MSSLREVLRRVGAEPLTHFVVLGIGLFGLHRAVAGPEPRADTVVVSADAQAWLLAQFEQRHGRRPSEVERADLIGRHVDEEVLYREGLALGLDRSDPIVRRRVVQRMQMLLDDLREPDEEQLQAWFEAHASEYAAPARHTIEHSYFSGEHARERAQAERARLLAGGEPGAAGQSFAHGHQIGQRTQAQLATMFGDAFAREVVQAPPEEWQVAASDLGWHVFRVRAREPVSSPALGPLRARVRDDWRRAQAEQLRERSMASLRARYRVQQEVIP